MVQGLGNQRKDFRSTGDSQPNGNVQPNGNSNFNDHVYVDYLAEARKNLGIVDEFSDEQAYQMGMLNALIGIGYELRKLNKHNKLNQ